MAKFLTFKTYEGSRSFNSDFVRAIHKEDGEEWLAVELYGNSTTYVNDGFGHPMPVRRAALTSVAAVLPARGALRISFSSVSAERSSTATDVANLLPRDRDRYFRS